MTLNKLIKGYQDFYENYENNEDHLLRRLQDAQTPSTVIVACSDSRVDPAMITNANYGDIFVIRNVANVIPPCENNHDSYHGTSAALEYAVNHLNVDNLIIMGHANCGGIKALIENKFDKSDQSFIKEWVEIMKDVKKSLPINLDEKEKCHCCEKEAIKQSIRNALTFDFIKEKHDNFSLRVIGWYFDIETGKMLQYDGGQDDFIDLSTPEHEV